MMFLSLDYRERIEIRFLQTIKEKTNVWQILSRHVFVGHARKQVGGKTGMSRLGTFLMSAVVITGYITLMPGAASAQSGFAGIVKDTTGAVLPGVTVEASSPALIEGRRSTITDERGQYKIVDLRPGTYT